MDIFAHLVISYIIAYFVGLNPTYFVLGGVILDIDHLLGYLYQKLSKKTFIKTGSFLNDIFYFPRTFLHSLFGAVFATGLLYIFLTISNPHLTIPHLTGILLAFFLGILLHLLLDSFDVLGIKWLYPYVHIYGKLPVAYFPGRVKYSNVKKFHFNSFFVSLIITCAALVIMFLFK